MRLYLEEGRKKLLMENLTISDLLTALPLSSFAQLPFWFVSLIFRYKSHFLLLVYKQLLSQVRWL
jgi:hypothetical protein